MDHAGEAARDARQAHRRNGREGRPRRAPAELALSRARRAGRRLISSSQLATDARPRRIALSGVESLTPSERRVAQMATDGPTDREIAQAPFVTARTVEVYLSSVYRRLGISSRSQLAAALAEPARP